MSDGVTENENELRFHDERQIRSYPEALEQHRRIKSFIVFNSHKATPSIRRQKMWNRECHCTNCDVPKSVKSVNANPSTLLR
ncbi:unnamed protein product [Ceratitis capitata]|uniref:(Mediterranean fruit fly) hypothetical protein n=1 Tax=Ceratitis capitata TaxID=7213 RepID=A0A811U7F4_CERCA|nr:unnamed protein product [Ceratitis capitata]